MIPLISFYGCAGAPQIIPNEPPPGVRLGPEVQLLNTPIKKTYALMDRDGLVHVLAATPETLFGLSHSELIYLVVGAEGVKHQQVVPISGHHLHLSMAFDNVGRLHALVDDNHIMLDQGNWTFLPTSRCRVLLHGGRDMACAFGVGGEEVGAPYRWNWSETGSAAACVLLVTLWVVVALFAGVGGGGGQPPIIHDEPSFVPEWSGLTHPGKVAVALDAGSACQDWVVIDPQTDFAVGNTWIASDNQGRILAVYLRPQEGTLGGAQPGMAFVRIDPGIFQMHSQAPQADASASPRIKAVSGEVISGTSSGMGTPRLIRLAIDPESGTGMVTASRGLPWWSFTIKDGKASPPVPFPSNEHITSLAAGGGERFHALTRERDRFLNISPLYRVSYHLYREGVWSAPTELAETLHYDPFVVSSSSGQAFAIWVKGDKTLAGRWIDVAQ